VETRSKLSGILTQGQWTVFQATGVEEAVALLRTNRIPVVIVEGSWRPILERLAEFPERPSIVVTALFADEALWAEVLNIGGYDVMAQPFDRDEVLRITESAMRSASRDSLAPQTLAISASAAC
jgi:DNA-binding response OmpR family regulator